MISVREGLFNYLEGRHSPSQPLSRDARWLFQEMMDLHNHRKALERIQARHATHMDVSRELVEWERRLNPHLNPDK